MSEQFDVILGGLDTEVDVTIADSTGVDPSVLLALRGEKGDTGAAGQDGTDGVDGADGFSPIATVSKVGDTATISITDLNGTTTANISDGTDGQDGRDGVDGQDGYTPIKGVDYFDGQDGQDGADGQDGFSPIATVTKSGDTATISITDANGTTTATVTDGADGQDGSIVSINRKTSSGTNIADITIDGVTTELYAPNGGGGTITDVEVDGTSVVTGGVAEIDLTGKSDVGHTHTTSAITDFPTLATVATSGSYNDLSNKPTIPTVNNATLTIQKNGTNVQTFTANASSNKTANITVPTKTSDITNDSGFITSSALPTKVSDLTNDAGYITGYTETDPIFTASAASGITSSDINNWDGKQDELVSGTNIRTINGTSILGSGDISVAAGGTPIPTADTVAEFDASAHMNSTDMTSQEVSTFVNSLITQGVNLIDLVYPIGSYYETSDSTFNPNATWGGTWVLEAEGLVHIGAGANYTIGDTGGEETHTLTTNEMPNHNHNSSEDSYGLGMIVGTAGQIYGVWSGTTGYKTGSTGGGQAHNNMQPYIVVNRWHRTA